MGLIDRIAEWERADGPALFRAMGVGEGSTVVDFGFGHGHFAVAAARAAGSAGRVWAIDNSPAAVDNMKERLAGEPCGNVEAVLSDGSIHIGLPDRSADFVLYYDILHMMEFDRRALLAEARRVLMPGGVLSALPFHMDGEAIAQLAREIAEAGFAEDARFPGAGPHFGMLYAALEKDAGAGFDSAAMGNVINFRKL